MSSYNFDEYDYDESEQEDPRERLRRLLEAHTRASIKAGEEEDEALAKAEKKADKAEIDAASQVGDRALGGAMLGGSLGMMAPAMIGGPAGAAVGLGLGALSGVASGISERRDKGQGWGSSILGSLNPKNLMPSFGASASAAPALVKTAGMMQDKGGIRTTKAQDRMAGMAGMTAPKVDTGAGKIEPYKVKDIPTDRYASAVDLGLTDDEILALEKYGFKDYY